MNYTILQVHLTFKEGKLSEVAVLWEDDKYVRATYSTLNPKSGYQPLTDKDEISPQLFQKVAGGGSYLDEQQKKQFFPGIKNWSR